MGRPLPSLVVSAIAAAVLCAAPGASPASAVGLPPGFTATSVVSGAPFSFPVALATLPDGRLLVAEKTGKVWVVRSGVRHPVPLWDGVAEVLENADRGLLDIAVDPEFASNRFVYFLYTVDPDSDDVDDNDDAFGRLTRYQVSASDSNAVDPASRTILMGASWDDAPIIGSQSHTIGTLRFARDGSLFVGAGDGAQFSYMDPGGNDPDLFLPGRADPSRDIGAFRSQDLDDLCGKILRVNPLTGQGYPGNPYWDGDPSSARSRVWAYGLRNPFRYTVKPGTGSTDPADDDPGTLYIGDVGWVTWEEIDVARSGGLNFGWPCHEGMLASPPYQAASPAHHGCGTIGTPPNPALPTAPVIAWNHLDPDQSTPPGFSGQTAIGGAFYTGATWPAQYQGRYFFADVGEDWIMTLETDALDQLVAVDYFADNAGGPVDLEADPATGDLLYVSLYSGEVRRVRWSGAGGDNDPVAVGAATPDSGSVPFVVSFSSAGSSDPDGDTLRFLWLFGDGGSSDLPNPQHTYVVAGTYTAVLVVDDGRGGIVHDSLTVRVTADFPFPTTGVLDGFERANGPLGPLWAGDLEGLALDAGAATQVGSGAWAVCMFESYGPLQEAYFTIPALTFGAATHAVLLKAQGASPESAHIEVRHLGAFDRFEVRTFTPGEGYTRRGATIPCVLQDGDRVGARAYANGVVEIYVNNAFVGAVSAAAWPWAGSGGRVGMEFEGAYLSRMDDFGGGNANPTGNRPPLAVVSLPAADTTFYAPGDTLRLAAAGIDPDDAEGSLAFHWSVLQHHLGHVHSVLQSDGTTARIVATNHGEGANVFYETRVFVSDPGALSSTAARLVFPEIDLSAAGLACVPPAPERDQPATFSFRVRNLGRMRPAASRWRLTLGETTIAEGDTVVNARDSVTVTRTLVVPGPAGVFDLRVAADTLAGVIETDESNNGETLALEVANPSADAAGTLPPRFALSGAYPNPSRGAVRFDLELPRAAEASMRVLDLQGREVWRAPAREFGAGRWTLHWDGRSHGRPAAAGLYLVEVRAGGGTWRRRAVLVP